MNVRETVNRLMALALADIPDSDEGRKNEARNAAVQALKLIEEHGLLDKKVTAKPTVPFEITSFDVNSFLTKLYTMDFDGAVAMIERLKRRSEKVKSDRLKWLHQDFNNEPVWTEKTKHAARRAGASGTCSYCGEQYLMLMWIANPDRQGLVVHLRCLRDLVKGGRRHG